MRGRDLSKAVVVSPDVGSADEASSYANRLELPLAIMDKRRHADDEKGRNTKYNRGYKRAGCLFV